MVAARRNVDQRTLSDFLLVISDEDSAAASHNHIDLLLCVMAMNLLPASWRAVYPCDREVLRAKLALGQE